ncbi:protein MEI2-like 6 [Cucurbita moschata]|uniref:Protein MEI2-like 6 n=1 Tax=Cucurbita moschata TaxID=3662 RepID=A0A6J1FQ49_CUCMO|nr:protein MEI2-like 6 [Cucurbita moschata]
MALRRLSSLNPNADPFPSTTPSRPPPPPHLRHALLSLPPLHGYQSYIHPYQPPHHPIFAFYHLVPPLPFPGGGGGVSLSHLENPVGNGDVKSHHKKSKIKKWVPSAPDLMPLETTTVMIKNIPNQLRRHNLLQILDEHCKCKNSYSNQNSFRSEYDFVYLPMDFGKFWFDGKVSNLGYAFVNFTSSKGASEFCKAYHRRQWEVSVNRKVCEIKRAKIQGLEALMEAFRNKVFWCHANNYLPVLLEPPSDGCRRYRVTAVGKRIGRPPPSPIKKGG